MTDEILDVHQVSKDGPGEYVVRCPHCRQVIGVEGERLGEIRGEQYQHQKRELIGWPGSAVGCDGWLQVASDAVLVDELPEVAHD